MNPHLLVDISAHGFGHLAQVAPVLNALRRQLPGLRLSVRSGLPEEKLRSRIKGEFRHIAERSDFGFVMHDAVRIDLAATAAAYRAQHADWAARTGSEAARLADLQADLILTDVAYLPLAGAAIAGIPALSMCSLNWADLFRHAFGHTDWAAPIHREILAAYNSAECFLRLTPAMPMPELQRTQAVAPVAELGQPCRAELLAMLGLPPDIKLVLVAFGGFDKDLQAGQWPRQTGVHWLIPQSWQLARPDMSAFDSLGRRFTDLLASVDAVLTKPGYGTFAEAACNGTPVLYVRREDWPEQDCLIDWLQTHARSREVDARTLMSGDLDGELQALWRQADVPRPAPTGAEEAAAVLARRLAATARGEN